MEFALYDVRANDGGYHAHPNHEIVVATSEEDACNQVRNRWEFRRNWDFWATKIEFDGFIITVERSIRW
jgi:hypothetical protein